MHVLGMSSYVKNNTAEFFNYFYLKNYNLKLQCISGTLGCNPLCPWRKPGNGGVSMYICCVGTGSTGVFYQSLVFIYVSSSSCRYAIVNLISYLSCISVLLLIYFVRIFRYFSGRLKPLKNYFLTAAQRYRYVEICKLSYCIILHYLLIYCRFTMPTFEGFNVKLNGEGLEHHDCKSSKSKLKGQCSKIYEYCLKFKTRNQFGKESVIRACKPSNFKLKGEYSEILLPFFNLKICNLAKLHKFTFNIGRTFFRYSNPSFAAKECISLVHNQVVDGGNFGWSTTRVSSTDQYLLDGG